MWGYKYSKSQKEKKETKVGHKQHNSFIHTTHIGSAFWINESYNSMVQIQFELYMCVYIYIYWIPFVFSSISLLLLSSHFQTVTRFQLSKDPARELLKLIATTPKCSCYISSTQQLFEILNYYWIIEVGKCGVVLTFSPLLTIFNGRLHD